MTPTLLTRGITVLLVGVIALHRYVTIKKPAGIDDYHRRIREAAALVPKRIGGWVGEDIPVPPRAIKVLDPNAILSRRYVNVENGTTANVLFVHCADAHDMVGHFPLRCYPAQGWNLQASAAREWASGDVRLSGMEYAFWVNDLEGTHGEQSIVVANCLFRPDGQVIRDMTSLSKSIVGAGGQAAGAAQIQLRFDSRVPPAQRDAAVVELVAGYKPAIDAVLAPLPK